ncbi:MAG: hypothetical protein KGR48_05535 [Alphaproteobacteria bacterium]|nr:hypothetical protein [Alphaproteobacteria bacterium]MDE2012494.1 hypothetical protein [Alphaproteobacteria bacterium]MDE2352383.1 hypothetical protein [Alphaproteobacteria bacterium]
MKGKIILLASAAAAMVAMTAAPASAEAWWENTKISGRMYYDLTNISQDYHDSSTVGNPKFNGPAAGTNTYGTGFDIKRFYIGIDHTFNDVFSANVTTDFLYDSGSKATQIYIKKAYLQAKFDPAFIVRLGSSDMPWIPFAEGVYGYRYVENTLIDRTKYGTSADWGAYLQGDLAGKLLSYEFAVVNGNGYKNPSRADSVDFEGRISLKYNGFVAAIGGYDGKLGVTHGVTTHHDATRFDAILAYVGNGAHVGVEYFNANDWKSVTKTTTDKADGYSFFGAYEFVPQWSLFGRYDYVNPKSGSSSVKDNYYNVGIQYEPYKMVDFSLVYKHDDAKGGEISTSNGTIGGITGPYGNAQGAYDEIGLFGNFQW